MCEMTTLVVARTSEAPHEQLPCLLDQGVKSSTMTFGQDNSLVGGVGRGVGGCPVHCRMFRSLPDL